MAFDFNIFLFYCLSMEIRRYRKFTDQEKGELVLKYCEQIANTCMPIIDICESLTVDPTLLTYWIKSNPEWQEMWEAARICRAHRYRKEADELIDNATIKEVFKGRYGSTDYEEEKESKSALNKALHRAARRDQHSAIFAPEIYGSYAKEIKELQKSIDEIAKKITDKGI